MGVSVGKGVLVGTGVLLGVGVGPRVTLITSSGGLAPSRLLKVSRLPSVLDTAMLNSPLPVM
jgi:hypothetical protein